MTEQVDPLLVPRRRGPPKGNQNARKHGFYSSALSPEEQDVLMNVMDLDDVKAEIALLRIKMARLISDPNSSDDLLIHAIRAFTRLVRMQYMIRYGR